MGGIIKHSKHYFIDNDFIDNDFESNNLDYLDLEQSNSNPEPKLQYLNLDQSKAQSLKMEQSILLHSYDKKIREEKRIRNWDLEDIENLLEYKKNQFIKKKNENPNSRTLLREIAIYNNLEAYLKIDKFGQTQKWNDYIGHLRPELECKWDYLERKWAF
jgi:hypothetical protein